MPSRLSYHWASNPFLYHGAFIHTKPAVMRSNPMIIQICFRRRTSSKFLEFQRLSATAVAEMVCTMQYAHAFACDDAEVCSERNAWVTGCHSDGQALASNVLITQ